MAATSRKIQLRWHTVTTIVTRTATVVRRSGRPKAGATPAACGVHGRVDRRPRRRRGDPTGRSTFILVSSRTRLGARTALERCERPEVNEHGFHWMKDALHLDAFYVQKPARVAGLGYLLVLALQWVRFMRALVRHALQGTSPLDLAYHKGTTERQSPAGLSWAALGRPPTGRRRRVVWFRHVARVCPALEVPYTARFAGDPAG